MILVLMGVSGSGKLREVVKHFTTSLNLSNSWDSINMFKNGTEVGSLLANKLGWKFYDADDYHPWENKAKMSNGIPLNDQTLGMGEVLDPDDRHPWLCIVHTLIKREKACGQHVVLACSALKRAYRKTLTTGGNSSEKDKQDDISPETLFIHLQGSMEVISKRMQKRKGHFMPLQLLESQFDTLEPPAEPELFNTVNVEKDIPEIVSEVQALIEAQGMFKAR